MKTCVMAVVLGTTVLLAVCMAGPLHASDFEVVTATGVLEPADLRAGQTLAEATRLELEPWGRALIRETTGCALTHVVIGLDEYVLTRSEDCAPTAEPLEVAGRLQRGEVFAARLKETGSSPADELVVALANEPCVFLPRFSEEAPDVHECPSGHALRGLRCAGSFCDDKDLLCCPYLGGEEDPDAKPLQARWISEEFPNVLKSKAFLNGLSCRGPYCDDLLPQPFKSSRLANARKCDWSAWASEQPGTWLDCGLGRFIAGLRCRGDYCADVGLYCCQVEVQ